MLKRILVFLDNFDTGGVTSVVQAIYRGLDRNRFRMDFVRRDSNINAFDREVFENDDNVYYFSDHRLNKIPILNYKMRQLNVSKQVRKTIGKKKYDVIHIHAHPIIGLHVAIKMDIPVRIMHTHEAVPDFGGNAEKSIVTKFILHKRMRAYNRYPTIKAGDSSKACIAKFGTGVIKDPKIKIIYPPVDMKKFDTALYSKVDIKRKFNIDETSFNMIHVGRLATVKNQSFMFDVLVELNKVKKTELYIVGEGELRRNLELYAEKLAIKDQVHFLPADTTPGLYTMMDCSLLPSFSEAFGMVAVESQCMGVPCFASVNVPHDVNIGMCSFIELDAKKWSEAILNYRYDVASVNEKQKEMFSINNIIKQVSELYGASIICQ